MRKMESYTYKKWNKMWRLWKFHKLHSPLEELVTYDNYMAHGHVYFFNALKNEINIKRYMFVLKEFLSKEVYENLETAYKIYVENLSLIKSGQLDDVELENMFMEVDEKYYEDTYELTKIIMQELAYGSHINISNFMKRNKVIKKVRSSK